MRTKKCLRYILIPLCIVILLSVVAAIFFLPNDIFWSSKTDQRICLLGKYDVATHTVTVHRKDVAVSLSDDQQVAWLAALDGQPITGGHTYTKYAFDMRKTLLCDLRVEVINHTDNITTIVYIDSDKQKGYCVDTTSNTTVYRDFSLQDTVLPLL